MTNPQVEPKPGDLCTVCSVTRVAHGDLNHAFSVDGSLVPLKPRPEPKNKPPRSIDEAEQDRMTQELAKSMELNAVMRLTEVLIDKGLLDSKETLYIFSGYKG